MSPTDAAAIRSLSSARVKTPGAIFIIEMGTNEVPKPEHRAQQYLLYSFLVSETHRVSSLRGGINRAHAFRRSSTLAGTWT